MTTRNPHDLPKTGKIIAFDVGKKTLGLALSDKMRVIASPMKTIKRTKWGQDKTILQQVVIEENVSCAVVGLPLTMSAENSAQTDSCLSFASLVENDLNLPVLLWDERLTTQQAEAVLFEQRTGRQTRASKKDVKEHVDSVAASLILKGVLDSLRF